MVCLNVWLVVYMCLSLWKCGSLCVTFSYFSPLSQVNVLRKAWPQQSKDWGRFSSSADINHSLCDTEGGNILNRSVHAGLMDHHTLTVCLLGDRVFKEHTSRHWILQRHSDVYHHIQAVENITVNFIRLVKAYGWKLHWFGVLIIFN